MEKAVCMTDHFDKIQKLPDPIPGVPNFRRVPGFKVYCCGQPTLEGFEKVLEKVTGTIYPKDGPIIWFNLRQEPTVYVNGSPVCARPPNKIGGCAVLGGITRDIIKAQETAFAGECEGRKSTNGGKLKVVDVNKKESEIEVKEEEHQRRQAQGGRCQQERVRDRGQGVEELEPGHRGPQGEVPRPRSLESPCLQLRRPPGD